MNKAGKVFSYLSLVKFSHIVFSLPFAIVGFFMGIEIASIPDIFSISAIFFCLIFARNAAMAFNRWIDRKYDSLNLRTKKREIPSGIISHRSVLIFIVVNTLLFILSSYFINITCFFLSPVALLVIFGYSYTKRISWTCHFILGLALAIAPVGAYVAVTGFIDINIIMLATTVMFWVAGFDIIYSIQDIYFDNEARLHSIPARFGVKKALFISRLSHVLTSVLLLLWWIIFCNMIFIVLVGTILFQLILLLLHLKIKDVQNVNKLFFTYNGFAAIVFSFFYLMKLFL